MPTTFAIQPSFAKGELSPRLHGRIDIDAWRGGLAQCLNWIVMRQGGLRRRPGTQYVATAKNEGAAKIVRPVPFEFSADQAYVLELGHLYMRVHGLGGTVMSGGSPYEIVTPWSEADLMRLQFAQSADVMYVTHRNYAPRKISRISETNWSIASVVLEDGPYLDINKTGTVMQPGSTGNIVPDMTSNTAPAGYTASADNIGLAYLAFDGNKTTDYTTGGVGIGVVSMTFTTPTVVSGYYVGSSSNKIDFTDTTGQTGADSVQTVYRVPGSLRAPRSWTVEGSSNGLDWTVLDTRAAQTGWGEGERRYYTFKNTIAYPVYRLNMLSSNSPDRPISISEWALQGAEANKQTVTITASSTTGINGGAGFVSTDVGRHLRLMSEDVYWHWFEIASVSSSTVITAYLMSPPLPRADITATVPTKRITQWRLGAFSQTTKYPQAIAFFMERLCYASTGEQPQTIWGSRTGDFDDFGTSIPLKPDDAFTFTFGEVGEIQWLVEAADLVAGTTSAIRTLGPGSKNEGFSATNAQQGKPARTGAAPVQPVSAGGVPVFVSRARKSVREASYSFDAQGYQAADITVLSEHLFRTGVTSIAYAQDPDSIIWCSLGDGSIVGITTEREQQMSAVHHHVLGGNGFVECLCRIPGTGRDEIWMVVRRTRPNATSMRTLERMAASFEGQSAAQAFHLDCGLTFSGVATQAVTGFSHLNGWTVGALADAATEAAAVVSGGTYTLPSGQAAGTISVGLSYTSEAQTLPISQGFGDGSGLGRKKRVKQILVNMLETGQLKVKATSRSYQDLLLRSSAETMDAAPPLVTDDVGTHVDDRWGGRGVVSLLCDGPQPATVRAVTIAFDGEP